MKRTMLAILAMTPLMMHAQVKSSAQPGSTPTLESSNTQPAAFAGIKTSDNGAAPTAIRISTGVTEPVLVHTVEIDRDHILNVAPADRLVKVGMTVDASGKPTDLKVVQASDEFTDAAILTAVRQYRFQPATLNGTPVPIGVMLNVKLQ